MLQPTVIKTFPCGCALTFVQVYEPTECDIRFCALHAAARKLLEACEAHQLALDTSDARVFFNAVALTKAAIATAKPTVSAGSADAPAR